MGPGRRSTCGSILHSLARKMSPGKPRDTRARGNSCLTPALQGQTGLKEKKMPFQHHTALASPQENPFFLVPLIQLSQSSSAVLIQPWSILILWDL